MSFFFNNASSGDDSLINYRRTVNPEMQSAASCWLAGTAGAVPGASVSEVLWRLKPALGDVLL